MIRLSPVKRAGRCRNSDGPHDGGAGASAARPRDLKFQQALRKP